MYNEYILKSSNKAVKRNIMQLTQFTDYALRALIYIAVREENCTISEIAKSYRISENHLVKIIHRLGQEGIITTTRGKHGGITLAKKPQEINLKEIISLLEPHLHIVECFNLEKATCRIIPVCKLKRILNEAKNQFLNILADYTLSDLIENKHDLQLAYKDKKTNRKRIVS